MNKKYFKKLGAFVVALSMGISILPTYATTDEVLLENEAGIFAVTELDTLDFNANYFADENNTETNNKYSVHFTAMENLPAFVELTISFKVENARVDDIYFDSSLSGSVRKSSSEENSIINQTIAITSSTPVSVSNRSKLLILDIVSSSALTTEQINNAITVTEFTVKKEDESTESFTMNYTMNEGPIIPTLDTETQKLYDDIVALPAPATLSFYNEDSTLKDLDALYNKVADVAARYQACAKKDDLNTVLEYYGYSSSSVSTLSASISAMKNCLGMLEIYDTVKTLENSSLINYQFIFSVYNDNKDYISLTSIPSSSPAYTQIQATMSGLSTINTTLGTVLSTAGYSTKIYSCEDALYIIQNLSSHKHYSDYVTALETQINSLITDINTNYSERDKEYFLSKLDTYKNNLELFKQGFSDVPVMSVNNLTLNISNNITFTRASALSDTMTASIIIEIADTNGNIVDTATEAFPSALTTFTMNYLPTTLKFNDGQTVVVTSYYVVNNAKFKIGSLTRTCTLLHVEEGPNISNSGGLGGGSLGGGGGSGTGGTTGSGGGTIFPSEVIPEKTPTSTDNVTAKLFNDIGNFSWASEAIEELYYAGIINGMEAGVFNPSGKVTREQFSKMVVQLFGISTKNANTNFLDVKSDAWYAPYINAALQAGYIQGQSGEYFGVGESIMRQDMATILYRALGDQNRKAVLDFTDNDNIAGYAQDAIAELVGLGVINGYEDGSFNPRGTATRAEAAKMIYGVYMYLNN